MFPLIRRLTTLTAAAAAAFAIAPSPTLANQFGQQDIDQSRVIAVASPVRNGTLHNLMILEQLSNQRPCWQETGNAPTQVEPLLLNFDFTGICNRLVDSNGYSLRVNGEDLGLRYRLEVLRQNNDLVLRATPVRDRNTIPPIEIARANGNTNGFAKLQLNPGWRMTRRTFNGQTLGHIYLTHDEPLNVPIAAAGPSLAQSGGANPASPAPATPAGQPLPTIPPQATNPLPPPPTSAPASGTYYRVIVPVSNVNTLQQVRAVEPEAFRTTVDGQNVVQVGLFRERQRAEEVQRSLLQSSIDAKILNASAPAPASVPIPPSVPQGQLVVVLDPGHGGRDPGAVGIAGIQEKEINLTIANRVQQRLQEAGVTVLMTRADDREIDLDPRVAFAQRAGADIFVSIHANAISMSRPEVNGLETYYYSSGQRLAQVIHNSVLRRTDMRDRGVRQARFYVLRYSAMPAVLVETGFVTGSQDAARFQNMNTRMQIADAIAEGILEYLRR
ncbi:DUF3747 domain-containing protein [Pseudanabaena sp. FACHB-2040]|uniref:DUF3747 domain-containing protein n=1 Tax=Pseudanabaena sp. FACHB-2040 TaxID=2692859 RepID=UPI00168932F9|nr:DUF3747 domain-containing protein [Pseudanabaena sp. FACHB-2040]MBD2260941.1 DUF3747 domain-containing protein [Pseudanabaena sp. FACHB-2040]